MIQVSDAVPNYLCVFKADPHVTENVVDLGLDPDFRPPAATWGICRPLTRRSVELGSVVVFLGYYADGRHYLVKGWLQVTDKIDYLDALKRFGDRPNVIVRRASNPEVASVERTWKRTRIREEVIRRYGSETPAFMTTLHVNGLTLVQNPEDDHEVDNWKCQRILLCQTSQLERCVFSGMRLREDEFSAMRNYVVAGQGHWHDVGRQRQEWLEVAPASLQTVQLRTPYGQHNARRLRPADVEEIVETLGGP